MTKKDNFEYLWKTLFLIVFGLIIGASAIYTLVAMPITVGTVIFSISMLGGTTFCGFAAKTLIKEWIAIKKNDAKFNEK